jgi:ferredoxin--NADP+ reductase
MALAQGAPREKFTSRAIRSVRHWTDTLSSITIEKPQDFAFAPGHYVRLGLPAERNGTNDATVWRAYSVVSAPGETELEFLITLIPGGAFTSQLAALQPGDPVLLESAALGFFLPDQLAPGESLWMLATGSGIGPYISMLRHNGFRDRFQRYVLVHSVRTRAELAYRGELIERAGQLQGRLSYLPIVTREGGDDVLHERIPTLLADGILPTSLDLPFDPGSSRVMVCGNPAFTAEMRALLNTRHFTPCRHGLSGNMVFENYW